MRSRMLTRISMRFSAEAIGATRDFCPDARVVMDHDAIDWIDRRPPWRRVEHPLRVLVTGPPARTNAGRREVYVLRVVLPVELGRDESGDMHCRIAAPRRELLHFR